MYINIQSQNDTVSMAERFHIGFYAKCKKKNVMKCICAEYLDSRKKHFEPPYGKSNKMTFVPSEDSDSLGIRPVWSESSMCAQWVDYDPSLLQADSADSDQTGRMPRLIWVFAGHTGHFVGFVMPWLNFHIETTSETIAYAL